MITAKDLQEKIQNKKDSVNNEVDCWLKNKVLPTFENNKEYALPTNIPEEQLVVILNERGISTELLLREDAFSRRTFIKLTVPQQGE